MTEPRVLFFQDFRFLNFFSTRFFSFFCFLVIFLFSGIELCAQRIVQTPRDPPRVASGGTTGGLRPLSVTTTIMTRQRLRHDSDFTTAICEVVTQTSPFATARDEKIQWMSPFVTGRDEKIRWTPLTRRQVGGFAIFSRIQTGSQQPDWHLARS